MRRAIYPGTFDPLTNGHLDLIKRGLRIFDEVIVAVAPSLKKQPLFTLEERLALIKAAVKGLKGAKAAAFDGWPVEHVRKTKGIQFCGGSALFQILNTNSRLP